MASVVSGTLVGGVAQSVTVDAPNGILITNTTQTGTIWVRLGGVAATVAGSDCYPVTGDRVMPARGDGIVVSLISSTTPVFSVEGLPA